jgi:ABC-type phosphate transport system permease subunit
VSTLRFGWSLLSASLAGACLVLPTIIRTTEEALLTVPDDYRRGSLALGATSGRPFTRYFTGCHTRIITGIILSVGRVISETAVFFVTLGGSHRLPTSIMDGGAPWLCICITLPWIPMPSTKPWALPQYFYSHRSDQPGHDIISRKHTAKVRGG